MNLNTLCGTIKTALDGATIVGFTDGLTVDLYEPRSDYPPQAWIQANEYTPETFGDTSGVIPITITVGVSLADYDQAYQLAYELVSNDTLGAALRTAGLQIGPLTYTRIGDLFLVSEVQLRGFQIEMGVYA